MLRTSTALFAQSRVGDIVMHYKVHGAAEPGSKWRGPARVIGHDNKTVRLVHNAVPVASAGNKLRPANVAEVLAAQVLSKIDALPFVDRLSEHGSDQTPFMDARPKATRRTPENRQSQGTRRPRRARFDDSIDDGGTIEEDARRTTRARTQSAASTEVPELQNYMMQAKTSTENL